MKKLILSLVLLFTILTSCEFENDLVARYNNLASAYMNKIVYVGQSKTEFLSRMCKPDTTYNENDYMVMQYYSSKAYFISDSINKFDINYDDLYIK